MKRVLTAISFLTLASISHADGKIPQIKVDANAINMACQTDAKTAKCAGEKVGSGLLKCLGAYKKANPTYPFSDNCKTAMQNMHKDRGAEKSAN